MTRVYGEHSIGVIGSQAAADGSPSCSMIRLYTGCGTPKNREKAMQCWFGVMDTMIPNLSPLTQARACACLAYSQWDVRLDPDNSSCDVDATYRACAFANMAIEKGLVSPIALRIAQDAERLGFRRWEDLTLELPHDSRHGVTPDKIAKLTSLWAVADGRKAELQERQVKWEEKQAKRPNAYACAAERCGIEATRKAGLMRCAGSCALEDKPSYCSKECQRRVSTR